MTKKKITKKDTKKKVETTVVEDTPVEAFVEEKTLEIDKTVIEKRMNPAKLQKHYRTMLLEKAVVKVGKYTLQADPYSLRLMSDAILALETLRQKETKWITADNKVVEISVDQLKKAQAMGMLAMSSVYMKSKGGQLTAKEVRKIQEDYEKATE